MVTDRYTRLLQRDDDDFEPEKRLEAESLTVELQHRSRRRGWLMSIWIVHFTMFLISISLLLYAWTVYARLPVNVLRHAQARHEQWTTVMGAVPENYHQIRFDGEFTTSQTYKGPPNADVDAAWRRLIPLPALQVDEQTFSISNASRYSVRVPEDLGQGYLAYLESVHYIHCVYALWQVSYPDYYQDDWQYGVDHPEAWHTHLDHCADILRQKLMCDADVGLLGFNWLKNHYAPHVNFNAQHQCRDYDAVLDFAHTHQADPHHRYGAHFLRPEGVPTVNYDEPPYDPFLEGDTDF